MPEVVRELLTLVLLMAVFLTAFSVAVAPFS